MTKAERRLYKEERYEVLMGELNNKQEELMDDILDNKIFKVRKIFGHGKISVDILYAYARFKSAALVARYIIKGTLVAIGLTK